MSKLSRLFGRKSGSEDGKAAPVKRDKAIIHQSVPDEVLYPDRKEAAPVDTTWLDEVNIVDRDTPADPAPAPAKTPPKAEAAQAQDAPAAFRSSREALLQKTANAGTAGRPRCPVGWLVVVDGPGLGDWFVLERGVSSIGTGDGHTVPLDTGAGDDIREARIGYDDRSHTFVLENATDTPLRLNGIESKSGGTLRDGDVFTIGATSLRLVALCSQNFHWGAQTAAQ